MVVNLGPHHPATHGVLRLAVELDGEIVRRVSPETGYLHSGFEKTGETKRYEKFIPYCDRMDYLAPMCNNMAYVQAVEKLLDVDIPEPVQYARVLLTELQRIGSHLAWLGTHAMDVSGTIHALIMYCFHMRERILDIFEMICGARMTVSYFSVGGLRWPLPAAFEPSLQAFLDEFRTYLQDFEAMLTKNPVWLSRLKGLVIFRPKMRLPWVSPGPCCGVPASRSICAKFARRVVTTSLSLTCRRRPMATATAVTWYESRKCARAYGSLSRLCRKWSMVSTGRRIVR
jgi:NADH:ubiquinone oxidoreductase subunit D